VDGLLVRDLDTGGDLRIGHRPQRADTLRRRERHVETGHRGRPRPRVPGDRTRQLPRPGRRPGELGGEHLPGNLGADPRPLVHRNLGVTAQPAAGVQRPDTPGNLDPERRNLTANAERRTQTRRRRDQLGGGALAELGDQFCTDRVVPGTEQRLHLRLGNHRPGEAVPDVRAARPDPNTGGLTLLAVVRR